MNFVFISCNYPENYWMFCRGLKKHGARVLAIIDTPYDALCTDLKKHIDDFYYVSNFQNYDEMIKACGYFTYKYGKIDWIESNNEAWLHLDAKLRDDFHVTTGFSLSDIETYQSKIAMKQNYSLAGIPTAKYCIVSSFEDILEFSKQVGYPLVLKPDKGVGACDTYKILNESELEYYYEITKHQHMILEEYIEGTIFTLDGITDKDLNIHYLSSFEYVGNCMDSVLNQHSIGAYTSNKVTDDLKLLAQDIVDAFQIRNRFFHCEFFRLNNNKELRLKENIMGLEVNFRPPGVFLPDLMNYTFDIDVYDIWAEILLHQKNSTPVYHKYFTAFSGRRNCIHYKHSLQDLKNEYANELIYTKQLPKLLSKAMGDEIMICRFTNKERLNQFFEHSFAVKGEGK